MNKQISEFLAQLLPLAAAQDIHMVGESEVPYGIQVKFQRGADTCPLNLYYSTKKGISKILGGKKTTALYASLAKLLEMEVSTAKSIDMHQWRHWIGSDECGKGDYFGTLVVCAFAADESIVPALKKLGIMDSKKLRDPQIVDIAKKVYQLYPQRISCISLKPLKYNEIYQSMQSQKKNLNDLLAWLHSTAILELLAKHPSTDGVLVDQFSNSMKVKRALTAKKIEVPVVERHGAEADIAVATASIVARYQFLQAMDAQSRFYKITFPKGAGSRIPVVAKEFVKQYGFNRLGEVAKLHFVTTNQIRQRTIGD